MPPQSSPPAELHQANKSSLPTPPPPTASSLSRLGAFARCRSESGSVPSVPEHSHAVHPLRSSSEKGDETLKHSSESQIHAGHMQPIHLEESNAIHTTHQHRRRGAPSSGQFRSRALQGRIPSIHNLVARGNRRQVSNAASHPVNELLPGSFFGNPHDFNYDGHPQQSQSFDGLVRLILSHPAMPVLVGELHETTSGSSLHIDDRRCVASMHAAAEKCAAVEELARTRGVETAANSYELLDLFFAALSSGISALRSSTPPPVPQPLHAVLAASNTVPEYEDTVRRQEASRAKIPERSKAVLEKWFMDHFDSPYPTEAEKRKLVKETGLRLNQINNYFGNRRMRTKRKRLEQDGRNLTNGLPYATSVLAPRTKWRTIVRPSSGSESVGNEEFEANEAHNTVVSTLLHGASDGIEREEETDLSPVSRGSSSGHGQAGSW